MAISHVQNSGNQSTTGASTLVFTLTGVSSGNSIAIAYVTATQNVSWTATDDKSNSYTKVDEVRASREAAVSYSTGVTGGDVQITLTISAGTGDVYAIAYEVGGTSVTFDTSDTKLETSVTTHNASTAGINTSAEVFAVIVGITNGATGAVSSTNYTGGSLWSNRSFAGYRTSASALSSETGQWTSGTARNSGNVIVALSESGGASGAAVLRSPINAYLPNLRR